MIIDIKKTKVYIISPGENKYRDRVLTVMGRLIDEGFKNITFFKSLPGPNNTASLTNTVIEICKKEMNNDQPFIILEDDCAIFTGHNDIEVPAAADVLYLGVALWSYPYTVDTLYNRNRPHIIQNSSSTVQSYNDKLTRIRGMTSGHAIMFISREFVRTFINKMVDISKYVDDMPHDLLFSSLHTSFNVYGLKQPMFYQDSSLGGQEDVTKLTFNGECYR
jgi:hypothetical protein